MILSNRRETVIRNLEKRPAQKIGRQLLVLVLAGMIMTGLAACCTGASDAPPAGFVHVTEAIPDAILEIRYHATYNFVGDRIDGYEKPTALLTVEAAKALKAVSDDVKKQGYRLKIYDAYRPQRAVNHFMRWAKQVGDVRIGEIAGIIRERAHSCRDSRDLGFVEDFGRAGSGIPVGVDLRGNLR